MRLLYVKWLFLMYLSICYSHPLFDDETKQEATPTIINYRLDTTVLPSHYDIKLTPYLQVDEVPNTNKKQFTFDGSVNITLKSLADVKVIVLHAKNLTIPQTTVLKQKANEAEIITVDELKLDEKTDKLTLTLHETMLKDIEYILTLDGFIGQMNDDMKGFYRSNYTKKDGTNVWIASTQFQPVHARKAFPCFDEPQFKATFQVTINHHKNYNAVSNTMKIGGTAKDEQTDRINTKFEVTPKMSTYLVAFIVSDFKSFGNETKIAVLAREDAESQTTYALEIGEKLLKKMEEFTGLLYLQMGNSKMHLAAIPDFSAGAMENWGLLTFRERLLLFDSKETTAAAQESIATVISHEQAHMWFGDYITCAWWNVTWLNEGFARYFEYFTTHEVEPQWGLNKTFVVEQIQSVFVMDSLNGTHPLTNKNTNSPSEVGTMFDSITYNKGASIIRMIQHMMGNENFKAALQSYFKDSKLQLSTTLPQDLFNALKSKWNHSEISLDDIKADWTEQVGYPLVTVELDDDLKTFNVSQKRFILKKSVENSDLKYTIPFTYATSKNVNFESTEPDLFLTKNKERVTVNLNEPVDWIVANKLQTGYYRVNYNDKGWELIHHALGKDDFDKIHEMNRAQIVDDLFNFGRSGLMSYDRVLHMLEYLNKETNYLPWYSALNGFSYLSIKIGQDNYELFRRHILALLENTYKKLGFEQKNDESRLDIYNRAQILKWACDLQHDDCIKKSKEYFENLKKNQTAVPVNIRSVVYCTALREGNESDFNFLWEKYVAEQVATERVLILGSLGCSKSKDVIQKYLRYILLPYVRLQDKSTAFSSTYTRNKENIHIVFDFIKSNLEEFIKGYGVSDVATLISNVASRFTTDVEKNQLQRFYDENKDKFGDSAKSLSNAVKNVDDNINWSKENLPKLINYLKSLYDSSNSLSLCYILTVLSAIVVILNNY